MDKLPATVDEKNVMRHDVNTMTWPELKKELVETFRPQEVERMEAAYRYAENYHQGQKRLSGDPYLTHVLATAQNLLELHCDADTLIAGLLHDCIEDTAATRDEIAQKFGTEVAELVDGVTKISTKVFRDSEERDAENLRKIMLAMVKDIRVIVIKLADRLHNMRTLHYLAPEKQARLSRETMEIYAPLAHRLGIGRVKNELEDLCFKYLHAKEYAQLRYRLAAFEERRHQTIDYVKTELGRLIKESAIEASIQGRMKHALSIWNKMRFQDKDLDQIYDIMALRVIVPTLKDCYAVLGIVHAHWKPLPRRFKDFIAMPKSNMYQSIHTTIISPSGEPLEIQIRTEEMHRTAEEGIAAHWSYKEGDDVSNKKYETKLAWFRQFLDWQQDLRDSREFMEALKIDLFEDEVFVFTPKGEVKSMRRGSTPIDFAYLIHSGVGEKVIGAKVNNRLVPLKHELKNGDIVEIITRGDAKPSRDWLKIVKTTKAKNRIRHYFRQLEREENIEKGRSQLDQELKRFETSFNEVVKKDRLLKTAQAMNFKEVNDLLVQLGDGNVPVRTVTMKLGYSTAQVQPPPVVTPSGTKQPKNDKGITVHGLAGMVVRFAQCCHPIPGDPISGFITQGRGISIHRSDCPNFKHMLNEPGRRVEVSWGEMQDSVHTIRLFVLAHDREWLLSELLQVIYDKQALLKGTDTRTNEKNLVEGVFTLEIRSQDHLNDLINDMKKIKGVMRVNRK